VDAVEHLILGAGPAGLRAAQVLAQAGREVLVLEKRDEIGPKTCAGGLTLKTVRELAALGFPTESALRSVGHIGLAGRNPIALDEDRAVVYTIPRLDLGQIQLRWAQAAGAEVRARAAVRSIDLDRRTVEVGGRRIRWRHLIGADGTDSAVRRALALPSPRAYFAAEYNVPGVRLEPLRVECDPARLGNGYFWVFPHTTYTSIGAVAPKHLVAPPALRRYLGIRLTAMGVPQDGLRLEGAALEIEYHGTHFPGGVHLAGDAAGAVSSLTAEGIYAALITGEEVARRILDPRYPAPKTSQWLRVKRRHDRLARQLGTMMGRRAGFAFLALLARVPLSRHRLAAWFLSA
jgi:flavin-dependent dehydrogenase